MVVSRWEDEEGEDVSNVEIARMVIEVDRWLNEVKDAGIDGIADCSKILGGHDVRRRGR